MCYDVVLLCVLVAASVLMSDDEEIALPHLDDDEYSDTSNVASTFASFSKPPSKPVRFVPSSFQSSYNRHTASLTRTLGLSTLSDRVVALLTIIVSVWLLGFIIFLYKHSTPLHMEDLHAHPFPGVRKEKHGHDPLTPANYNGNALNQITNIHTITNTRACITRTTSFNTYQVCKCVCEM